MTRGGRYNPGNGKVEHRSWCAVRQGGGKCDCGVENVTYPRKSLIPEDRLNARRTDGFITKDSGEREQHSSGMVRDTQTNKPRFDLIILDGIPYEEQMLTRLAGLLARGAEKYGERNFEKANSKEEMDRAKSSAIRHFMQWMTGEVDEDHAAAVMFNIIEVEMIRYRLRGEDA